MQSFTQYMSQHVPWFLPVLVWCSAIVILLVLIALPAYFIVFPLLRELRHSISMYLPRLVLRHRGARENRSKFMTDLVSDFRQNSGLSFLSARLGRVEASLITFSDAANQLVASLTRFLDVPRSFERVADRLTQAIAKPAPTFPEIPTAEQLSNRAAGVRTAWVRLIVSSVILIAIVAVNTGMLGQILRSLDFIPRDLVYLGVPLYLIFAFILTLAEAGLGYVHTAGARSPEEPERIAVWPVMAIGLAAVIACVEGFFYSQVAPNREALVELPIGYSIKQGTLFFLWGATLVSILFGLGTIWSKALERITRSADHFPALVHRLSKYKQKFVIACEGAETTTARIGVEVEKARVSLQESVDKATIMKATLEQLKQVTSEVKDDKIEPHSLTEAEAYQFLHLSGLWFALVFCGICISVGMTFYAVGYTFRYLPIVAHLFESLGITGIFVVLGLLFPRGDLILDGSGNRRLVVSGSPWRARTALILACLVTCGFVLLFWRVRLAGYQVSTWVIVLLVGGFLAAASSQAALMSKGLRFWLYHVAHFLRACLETVARLLVRIALAAIFVTELIFRALATPIYLFRRQQLPPLIPPNSPLPGGDPQAVAMRESEVTHTVS